MDDSVSVTYLEMKFPDTFLFSLENGKGETVSREVLWWDGIELAPPRPRRGLLAKMWETHQKKEQQRIAGEVNN